MEMTEVEYKLMEKTVVQYCLMKETEVVMKEISTEK